MQTQKTQREKDVGEDILFMSEIKGQIKTEDIH